jgi:hypothetical protein
MGKSLQASETLKDVKPRNKKPDPAWLLFRLLSPSRKAVQE